MPDTYSLETRLQALGRLLDNRPRGIKDLCIIEAEGGFVVSLLEPSTSQSGPALVPATVFVEAEELRAAARQVIERPKPPDRAGARARLVGAWLAHDV